MVRMSWTIQRPFLLLVYGSVCGDTAVLTKPEEHRIHLYDKIALFQRLRSPTCNRRNYLVCNAVNRRIAHAQSTHFSHVGMDVWATQTCSVKGDDFLIQVSRQLALTLRQNLRIQCANTVARSTKLEPTFRALEIFLRATVPSFGRSGAPQLQMMGHLTL